MKEGCKGGKDVRVPNIKMRKSQGRRKKTSKMRDTRKSRSTKKTESRLKRKLGKKGEKGGSRRDSRREKGRGSCSGANVTSQKIQTRLADGGGR